jgi:AAA ATPase domain
MTVLFGECVEESHAPYLPWISALSHLVRQMDPVSLSGLTSVGAWALRRLLPAEAEFLPAAETVDAEPDTEQFLLMQSVDQVLERATIQNPAIIVLDDLQWADSSSPTLLRHLVGSSAGAACLIMGTYRQSDLGADHPLTGLLAVSTANPSSVASASAASATTTSST